MLLLRMYLLVFSLCVTVLSAMVPSSCARANLDGISLPTDVENDSANRGTICCLHDGAAFIDDDRILLFNPSSLARCFTIQKIRYENNLKHASIVLPSEVDTRHGYHMRCYRKFCALPKKYRPLLVAVDDTATALSQLQRTTRSQITTVKPSIRTGLFPSSCIFCGCSRKKIRGREQKLINAKTRKFETQIRKFVMWKNDKKLEAMLQGVDFPVKEVKYHGACRAKYQFEAQVAVKRRTRVVTGRRSNNIWHVTRAIHRKCFTSLTAFIQDEVVSKNDVLTLKNVNHFYTHLVNEFAAPDIAVDIISQKRNWCLAKKILKFFTGRVTISTYHGTKAFHQSGASENEITQKLQLRKENELERIQDVALMLRHEIQKCPKNPFPENLTLKDLEKGEVEVPSLLTKFFEFLIGGPDIQCRGSSLKQIRIRSIVQDSVYAATSGRKRPKKHLLLGIALKSITGSRKVLEILNRLGHCASYHSVEEAETELTFEATRPGNETPFGMKTEPQYATGVAWDNYDRFVETDSGKDTLHDTVGIAYQILPDVYLNQTNAECVSSVEHFESASKLKRRRSYEPRHSQIEPYRKRPRMTASSILGLDDPQSKLYESQQPHYLTGWKLDVLWMCGFSSAIQGESPMWAGWTLKCRYQKEDYCQKIWYLPQINQSPTSRAVVLETMKRSLKIAEEAGRTSIAVTYDLAIAKLALQIQAEEAPAFNGLFISLGAFHIEMAFFSALGKIVSESGGPELLNECGVLAAGSMKSFLQGKNFKRCRRLHEILSLALEVLHFESFLKDVDDGTEALQLLIDEREHSHSTKNLAFVSFSSDTDGILKKYQEFCDASRDGTHGKTAKFWMQYVDLMHLYHNFSRSVRDGNFQLYITCLPKVTNYFFALNHLNYARWLTLYYSNMINLQKTHPEVYAEFKAGMFSIRRSTKPFSATPIDLALEQTINADAASQRTGISAMTNSISARQRWADSHFLRVTIVSKFLDELGLAKVDDCSKDLSISRVEAANSNVCKVISMIRNTMNPFHCESDKDHLFNITTGKAAADVTEKFLLNICEIGDSARKKFTGDCVKDPTRFEKRIQSQSLKTFATERKKNLKSRDGKLEEACLIRDIFGSLLCYSLSNCIDICEVLKYPLSPIPLSLCHVDGCMHKAQKSALMRYLENKVSSQPPLNVDVTIVDGSFFLHLHQNLPASYGGVARYLLSVLMETRCNEIHFVSDKWVKPSIKDCERDQRMMSSTAEMYTIEGPSQKRPSKWIAALKNSSFKLDLIKFLIDYWTDDSMADIIGRKILFANNGDICYKYSASNGCVHREIVPCLYSTHEEADNRMFFHVSSVAAPSNVVIRTNDTDCLVIALSCKHNFDDKINLWLEVGVQSNNSQRFISINDLQSHLGPSLCKSLLTYHAFTGSDYSAAFTRKGKVTPFKLLEKDRDLQSSFADICFQQNPCDPLQIFERFVCQMYGQKNIGSVDDARAKIFFAKYDSKSDRERLRFTGKLDAGCFPPLQTCSCAEG